MLINARSLNGFRLDSFVGEIGDVEEFNFDDRRWPIRDLVADTVGVAREPAGAELRVCASLRRLQAAARFETGEMMRATQKLHDMGQSLWLDNISRGLLTSGTLRRYIQELSVTGLTSNPTIFEHAIKNSHDYDDAIRRKSEAGQVGGGACSSSWHWRISNKPPICCGRFTNRPSAWTAGCRWRSRPGSQTTRAGTIAAAKELHARAGRPNLFIKIPGTKEGLPAIEEAIFAGVPVNVTLLFLPRPVCGCSRGVRAWDRGGASPPGLKPDVFSVASIFISRWDVAVRDKVPEGAARPARRRHRRTGLRVVPTSARLAALAAYLQRRRAPAAPALGQHRYQGPGSFRHPVHRRALPRPSP